MVRGRRRAAHFSRKASSDAHPVRAVGAKADDGEKSASDPEPSPRFPVAKRTVVEHGCRPHPGPYRASPRGIVFFFPRCPCGVASMFLPVQEERGARRKQAGTLARDGRTMSFGTNLCSPSLMQSLVLSRFSICRVLQRENEIDTTT